MAGWNFIRLLGGTMCTSTHMQRGRRTKASNDQIHERPYADAQGRSRPWSGHRLQAVVDDVGLTPAGWPEPALRSLDGTGTRTQP